jgi:hypothetical protein
MCKTFYLSIDGGDCYKRMHKDEARFKKMMWDISMRALYPEALLKKYGEPLSITIRDAIQLKDNYTFYVHDSDTIDDVWNMINKMWDFISSKC